MKLAGWPWATHILSALTYITGLLCRWNGEEGNDECHPELLGEKVRFKNTGLKKKHTSCTRKVMVSPQGFKVTHLVLFQGHLSLLFASDKCSDTPVDLFILLYPLYKISRKKANPVFYFALWRIHTTDATWTSLNTNMAFYIYLMYRGWTRLGTPTP